MARNKETLLLLLDVGPSMHDVLPEVEKVCSLLVEKKLIYNKSDEVGLILFGTEDTKNELTREVGGYEHVVVLRDTKVVDGDLVETLQHLPRGTFNGDFLDAIIVGMDILIKRFGKTDKKRKRICLITNALCPIKDPFQGSKEDQIITIGEQMVQHGMGMESIVVRGRLSENANKRVMDENDLLLNIFSKTTCAKLVHVESPISLFGALRTRNISPVTIFRGDLEISSKMKIKVWVYKKTSEEKFPTLKKYSDKAPATDKFATHEVKVDYEYKNVEGPSRVVPPEERIKGYRYGPQVVPIAPSEWDAVKFKPEKSVKLLGFTDASNIMRHYYMKDANVFIADPGNTRAVLAVSALARAMKEKNKVAIVRCVWRNGQGNVVVGVLTPNVSEKENIPDSLYFNVLPFAEDVREFQFPSFNNLPASWQPNEQQQEAADNLVKMLDLALPGKEEALQPDFTPNPLLERFYRHLELKSKHPDAAVPPLDETLKKITEPDPELLSQNKSVIDAFRRIFELKEKPKLKKSNRRFLRENPSGSNKEEGYSDISAQLLNSSENTSAVKVEKIGDLTPVQDFETMMSRRDGPEWVGKAIKDLKNKIFDMVEDSHEGDNYSKALECLVALRKGCILEQEPKHFNDFLHHLSNFCREKDLDSFCEFLASKELTLISKTEAIDSEVSDAEARSFLVKLKPKTEDLSG
ncbi:ATP-dependent DNA helicase 2 subunit KU80 [Corylus avellana]|uniref:ATP-dependent DNA helicase 2 subunit KU80 n=1 Tax=Corylus avellana TaxID=13451 RepID=UPI00286A9A59|nr:ATP-dependent DNA helicase 2 subunit KU80 [Corylus avellana]